MRKALSREQESEDVQDEIEQLQREVDQLKHKWVNIIQQQRAQQSQFSIFLILNWAGHKFRYSSFWFENFV